MGAKQRILDAANHRRIDGFIDTAGNGSITLTLDLAVAPHRVNTVVDFATAREHGISTLGTGSAGGLTAFTELAGLAATGRSISPSRPAIHSPRSAPPTTTSPTIDPSAESCSTRRTSSTRPARDGVRPATQG